MRIVEDVYIEIQYDADALDECEVCGLESQACGDLAIEEHLCVDCYLDRRDAQEEDAHDGRREDRRDLREGI